MKQPEKWKETIDPFKIAFNDFKLLEVLGYPHARNDVFYVRGLYNEKEVFAFLKYGSKPDSNILKEIEIIKCLNFSFLPKILDSDKNGKWCITEEIDGERLSYILAGDKTEKSINYMFEYGKTLAQIHKIDIECEKVKHRKFFDIPTLEYLKENKIEFINDYLSNNKPATINECFCHGDFHYANILWKDKKISAVLDWELSGIGNKEFDIAWAIINRPSQKFLRTKKEMNEFLKGYKSVLSFNKEYVEYYIVQIYSHFISVGNDSKQYQEYIIKYLKKHIKHKSLSVQLR